MPVSVFDLSKRRRSAVRPSPIFLAFVAVRRPRRVAGCLGDTTRSDSTADFGVFLMVVAGWVVSLCLHEFSHAYAAYRAGDRSVEAGRAT